MTTVAVPQQPVNPATGLIRGQAATISRIHRVSIAAVLKAAKTGRGRAAMLATIAEYRAKNAQASEPAPAPTA